jgi:hypothetical protein
MEKMQDGSAGTQSVLSLCISERKHGLASNKLTLGPAVLKHSVTEWVNLCGGLFLPDVSGPAILVSWMR